MIALSIGFAIAYACLLGAYLRAWKALPEVPLPAHFKPQTPITVLIPARDEAAKIEACLRAALAGSYPHNLLEIIVLDDFSEDGTAEVLKQFLANNPGCPVSFVRLSDQLPPEAENTPNKKKALELGLSRAKGEIVVTTDADCQAPENWLVSLASAFEDRQTKMVCAPVLFHRGKNLLQRFQALDFLGMMGITGAGYQLGWHAMANGANLAIRKWVFEAASGYAGNEQIASGDDMFLVQKVSARWPGSVVFLKNAAASVQTQAMPDWRAFWHQRLRWGTKNAAYPNWPLRMSLLAMFLFCWSIWANLLLAAGFVLAGIPTHFAGVLVFQIAVKAGFDYFFLAEMCRYFKRTDLLKWFWPSFLLHTAYIALLGTASIFADKYNWKGRNVRTRHPTG